MKRSWLVLLSLGLIVTFSTSAMAVVVRVSGEFYSAGMYLDSVDLVKSGNGNPGANIPAIASHNSLSTAFYFQRLRVNAKFVIAPGLILHTRADVMERAWGAARSNPQGGSHLTGFLFNDSAGTDAENENIAFDHLYLEYLTPIGLWQVGLGEDYVIGTPFGDSPIVVGKVLWAAQAGSLTFAVQIAKQLERSASAIAPIAQTDTDIDNYSIVAFYNWKTAEAGMAPYVGRGLENTEEHEKWHR